MGVAMHGDPMTHGSVAGADGGCIYKCIRKHIQEGSPKKFQLVSSSSVID